MSDLPPPAGGKVHFRRAFITGFIALFPLLLTLFVLGILWQVISRVSTPLGRLVTWSARSLLGYTGLPQWTGTAAALVLTGLLIYLMGLIITSIFGRRLLIWFERIVARLPIVGYIYPHAKLLSDFLFGNRKVRFNRVVAIEYPRRGLYTIGFVTSNGIEAVSRAKGRQAVAVFIPTSPTPLTGWTVLVDETEIVEVDMTVDEAVRFVVSCGVIVPGDFLLGSAALPREIDSPAPAPLIPPSRETA
jgi:uncharacterized membrane protein